MRERAVGRAEEREWDRREKKRVWEERGKEREADSLGLMSKPNLLFSLFIYLSRFLSHSLSQRISTNKPKGLSSPQVWPQHPAGPTSPAYHLAKEPSIANATQTCSPLNPEIVFPGSNLIDSSDWEHVYLASSVSMAKQTFLKCKDLACTSLSKCIPKLLLQLHSNPNNLPTVSLFSWQPHLWNPSLHLRPPALPTPAPGPPSLAFALP